MPENVRQINMDKMSKLQTQTLISCQIDGIHFRSQNL